MIRKFAFALLVVVLGVVPSRARAQGQTQGPTRCDFTSDRFTSDSTPAGMVVFMAGNVRIRCRARGITLRGDSAERYPDRDFVIGHVVYDEPRLHLTSDFLNHFATDERVLAVGNVNAKLPSGSTLVGPIAEFKRASPRLRPRDQLFARSRPTITIVEKDTTGKVVPPTTVVAQNVFMDGDSLIYAGGEVVITRPDIKATADSVFLDQAKETMQLIRHPSLEGKKERPYTLTGDLIDLYSKNKKLVRVISRANATAKSDSMTLTSDTIDLRVKNDLLERAYAWGTKSRAKVESPSQNLLADSVDVFMPDQRIRVVRALRKAFAESSPDTTRFVVEKKGETDWLRGDTIVAHFDSTAAKDTSKRKSPDVKNLFASGNASSFYHLAASDSAERRPAINYVTARVINIDLNKSRVATVTTVDSVSGVYLEPRADTASVRAANGRGAPNGRGAANGGRPLPPSVVPLPPKRP